VNNININKVPIANEIVKLYLANLMYCCVFMFFYFKSALKNKVK
jgi:hypothetical protein